MKHCLLGDVSSLHSCFFCLFVCLFFVCLLFFLCFFLGGGGGVNIAFNTIQVTMGSALVRGNQYIQLVKVLYCKLPNIGKQQPTFLHTVRGLNCRPQRWEASVLALCQCGPISLHSNIKEG